MISRDTQHQLVLPTEEQTRAYQEWTSGLLMNSRDPQTGLVRGQRPLTYCLRGIEEETEEVVEQADGPTLDSDEMYKRLEAVLGLHSTTGDETEVIRHQKEFGDVMWYVSNALFCEQAELSFCVQSAANSLQRRPRSVIQNHAMLPGIRLISAIDELRHATFEFWIDRPALFIQDRSGPNKESKIISDPDEMRSLGILKSPDDRGLARSMLVRATSGFVVAAAEVLQTNFDTTLPEILNQNIDKIQKRVASNTVYKVDGVGGDDR